VSHLYKEVIRVAFSKVLEDQAGQDVFSRQLALTAAQLYGNDGAHTFRQGKAFDMASAALADIELNV